MRRLAALIAVVIFASVGWAQQFLAPQHDARIAIGLSLWENQITKFYDVYYGHNIRLGEAPFYCGDPLFLVHVNEVPRLSVNGDYPQNGDFGAFVNFSLGANAKIYETCLGIHNPNAGGIANLSAHAAVISGQDTIKVSGNFSTQPILAGMHLEFPISTSIPIPAKLLDRIPVHLTSTSTRLDFGSVNNGNWNSTGPDKDIPLILSIGAVGSSANGSSFLVVDANVGTERPKKQFPTQAAAIQDFSSDLPITGTENIGVSVKPQFIGSVSEDQHTSSGALHYLLPIRASSEGVYKILFWKRKITWEAALTSARVDFVKHEGKDAINVTLGSSYVKLGSKKIVGSRALKMVTASILFDRLTNSDGNIKFRVADFGVKLKFRRWLFIPVRLSSGALEAQLNGGTIPIATSPQTIVLSLPDQQFDPPCIYTGWEKTKADYHRCNDPDQRIGFLSFEPGYGSGKQKLIFLLEPDAISNPRIVNGALQVAGQITVPE